MCFLYDGKLVCFFLIKEEKVRVLFLLVVEVKDCIKGELFFFGFGKLFYDFLFWVRFLNDEIMIFVIEDDFEFFNLDIFLFFLLSDFEFMLVYKVSLWYYLSCFSC